MAGLIEQGMSQGAAMSFVVAGGVSCIPAAVAVWAMAPGRGGDGGEGVTEVAGSVVVDAVSNEGNKTVLISQPAEDEGATVIWLLDEEEADDRPLDGEDPI